MSVPDVKDIRYSMTCYMCPRDWRFHYSKGIAIAKGKEHGIFNKIDSIQSLEEIPLELRDFHKLSKNLYEDDQFIIVHDSAPDSRLHLLFIPIDHIENAHILDHPDLLKDMFLAGHFITRKSSSLKETHMTISSKKTKWQGEYFKHFHLHLSSEDLIDEEELVGLLTPGFYKGYRPNG